MIAPIQQYRRDLDARDSVVEDVLANGAARAAKRADETLGEVREVMGLA